MILIAAHLALGLLLGALCGVGMTSNKGAAQQLMGALSVIAGAVFIIAALAAQLTHAANLPTERLADVVMGGVATSLLVSVLALNLPRLHGARSAKA